MTISQYISKQNRCQLNRSVLLQHKDEVRHELLVATCNFNYFY